MENLEDIKVGDIVVVENRFGGQIRVVNKIKRLIAIDTGVESIYAMDGKERKGDSTIREATQDEIQKFKDTLVKEELSDGLSSFYWKSLSVEKLQKVYELINK